ncbi:GTP cyclohydrolase I [Marinospirillum celere]|uniref:GTP cyclohydrolase I n=1 Tax=Marinospirillum celere TaxID=1122252 RepID=A0A1I1FY29_9GAMM|nr:GTP cyclohydrolase FolE2 [Marinospirillum celere]SFC01943.1 GTP cyclohydrolase I [Marinospirillum celere]
MNAQLPDVASQTHQSLHLDQVGMAGIPIRLQFLGQEVTARITVTVDLDAQQRGIHMSRLYLGLEQLLEHKELTPALLGKTLQKLLATQGISSEQLRLELSFEWLRKASALLSGHQGWQAYPIRLVARVTPQGYELLEETSLLYSSTCPCSSALSREALAEVFAEEFSSQPLLSAQEVTAWLKNNASLATPHSQRSQATLGWVSSLENLDTFSIAERLQAAEKVLGTAVQTAVKRPDEQAFALRNGANQMFCEDAARRLAGIFETCDQWLDAKIHVEHFESLHAHDAVASKWLTRRNTPAPWLKAI